MKKQSTPLDHSDKYYLLKLIPYLNGRKKMLFIAFIILIFATISSLVLPLFIKISIDEYIVPSFQNYYLYDKDMNIPYDAILIKEYPNQKFVSQISVNHYYNTGLDLLKNTPQAIPNQYTPLDTMALIKEEDTSYLVDQSSGEQETISEESYRSLLEPYRSSVFSLSAIMLVILIFEFFSSFAYQYLVNIIGHTTSYNIRKSFFDQMTIMDMSFHEVNATGKFITRITSDINAINILFSKIIVPFFRDFFTILGIIIIMFILSPALSIILVITVPFLVLFSVKYRKKAQETQIQIKNNLTKVTNKIYGNIHHLRLIQQLNMEDEEIDSFDKLNTIHRLSVSLETKIYAHFYGFVRFMYVFSIALLIAIGGGESLNNIIQIGVFVAFFSYFQRFYTPIYSLAQQFDLFQSSLTSWKRVYNYMSIPEKIINPLQPVSIDLNGMAVKFDKVTFYYNKDHHIFENASIEIMKNSYSLIAGPPGCGKYTFGQLVMRIYEVNQGEIYINDASIKSYTVNDLRQHVGLLHHKNAPLYYHAVTINIDHGIFDVLTINTLLAKTNALHLIDAFDEDNLVIQLSNTKYLSSSEKTILHLLTVVNSQLGLLIIEESYIINLFENYTELFNFIQDLLNDCTVIFLANNTVNCHVFDKVFTINDKSIQAVSSTQLYNER